MPRLPLLSGRKIIYALEKIGYRPVRQRGSHIGLFCEGKQSVTAPNYDLVGRGLMRKILRDAVLSPSEFMELLK